MLSINTDINSIKIQNQLSKVTERLNSCTKRLSTGQKLNDAKDNAAGLFISSGLSTRINSFNIGISASQTGASIINIAEGTLSSIENSLLRLRDLSIQAASDYYTSDERNAMQSEANEIISQITQEKAACNFNGVDLLSATSSLSSQAAAASSTTLISLKTPTS